MRHLLVILTLGACTAGDAGTLIEPYECQYPIGLGLSSRFDCDVERGADDTIIEFRDGQLSGAIRVPAGDKFEFTGEAIKWRRQPMIVSGEGEFYDTRFHVFMGSGYDTLAVYGARKK